MSVSKAYLLAYNAAQAAGWAYLLYLLSPHLSQTLGNGAKIYAKVEFVLKLFQTAAVLEIVHAAVGLVR